MILLKFQVDRISLCTSFKKEGIDGQNYVTIYNYIVIKFCSKFGKRNVM